ncbi:MAG: two-component system response regulator [Desulfobacteraceae bacterium IS3]|nr:MAG: two-component system response regulator [Desulfobacteraceae bacterium IS3]
MAKTIMVVDDALSVRGLMSMSLENAGYRVIEANDGKDALNKLSGQDVHLIFVDIYMPNMDGIELIKTLKANPRYRLIPVVVLTKEGSPERKQEGQAAGAKAWIVKPFKPKTILDVVKKIIG